jgi:hypothetical protein
MKTIGLRRRLALLIDPSLRDELAWGESSNRAAWRLYKKWPPDVPMNYDQLPDYFDRLLRGSLRPPVFSSDNVDE